MSQPHFMSHDLLGRRILTDATQHFLPPDAEQVLQTLEAFIADSDRPPVGLLLLALRVAALLDRGSPHMALVSRKVQLQMHAWGPTRQRVAQRELQSMQRLAMDSEGLHGFWSGLPPSRRPAPLPWGNAGHSAPVQELMFGAPPPPPPPSRP